MKSFLLFLAISLYKFTSFAAEPIRVLELKGKASERVERRVIELKVGTVIHDQSQIIVDQNSVLIIGMGKDVVTKLGPGSKSTVRTINQKDWELKLDLGITASAIRNPEKRPNHFQVRTRTVLMGVRGTVFYTETLKDKPTFMCTCKGTVSIQDEHGKQLDSITATHHDRPVTLENASKGKDITIKTAPMGTGHSDADVTYLENLLQKL